MHGREFVTFFQSLGQLLVAFLGEVLTENYAIEYATQTLHQSQ